MTSLPNARDKKRSFTICGQSLVALGFSLALLAGCATTDPSPTTPIFRGDERPESTRPDRPAPPKPREEIEDVQPEPEDTNIKPYASVIPRHLQGLDPTGIENLSEIAILLPLSSSNAGVRKQAESILAGAEMALFQAGIENVILIPKDTSGIQSTTREVAIEALKEGADAFIGPVFAENVAVVQEIAAPNNIPVLAFSTNNQVAGNGVYLVSLPLEEEIKRIVDWASLNGVTQFAMFGPANSYGYKVESALRFEVSLRNGSVIKTEFYDPNEPSPTEAAKRLAQTLIETDKYFPGEVAVLIPEQGTRLRSVAPLLPYYDVDIKTVKLLGTGLWNSADVWREPTLEGGVFAAPDPTAVAQYNDIYRQITSQEPTSMSTLGYDATLMSLMMLSEGSLNRTSLERRDGFIGTNGLFRFKSNGTIERGLSVVQVTGKGGIRVIEPGIKTFQPDGF
ncbi:penicillin-binding protein activator [Hirschia baltica]|uniref:Extracellular ligand-binding receptor n=1 Tax=Hirschia baltica (strain ATCC 49814 / DSM 5838 / IFAM 1418) TaxID=582402 RepID=C6XIG9_HIRBI|nr:penicillin-binding protein activator [Hirschia baltica]ACT60776.1 extracellular ligand-binding receptor [Hirschia baltica ATCC 49814]